MKTVAIIQARLSSKRLPAKVLKELPFGSGISAIEQVVNRVIQSKKVSEILVATSVDASDDQLHDFLIEKEIPTFRGSLNNVLERYYKAALNVKADTVVRITGDCPIIDPEVIDSVVLSHFTSKADFTSNAILRTLPIGYDVGVFSFEALESAHQKAVSEYDKEHVTSYFYLTSPHSFSLNLIKSDKARDFSNIRLTLDTKDDYTLLCAVFDYLYKKDTYFGLDHVIKLFEDKPWLQSINVESTHKKYHSNLLSEIIELKSIAEKMDLKRAANWIDEKYNLDSK